MQELERNKFITFITNKNIKKENVTQALKLTGIMPGPKAWRIFIDQILLWFGALSLALSVIFFVAYNWSEFGRFGQFALVEGLLAASVAAYWYLGGDKLVSKALLLVSSLILGALQALFGQTYQTGADPWQLFFYWAVLMLPWVLVGRFSVLWMLWVLLINTAMTLYVDAFGGFLSLFSVTELSLLWLFFVFNTLALVLWEFFSTKQTWLDNSWSLRVLGLLSGASATALAVGFIQDDLGFMGIAVWLVWLGGVYFMYRVKKIDLFMLAITYLSFSIIVVDVLVEEVFHDKASWGLFLLVGIVIIGLGIGFSIWLKSLMKEEANGK